MVVTPAQQIEECEETGTTRPSVGLGSVVEVEWEDGARGIYGIGSEPDLDQGVIAADAPLARAILGAREGDTRTFPAGRCLRTVRVVRVKGSNHDA